MREKSDRRTALGEFGAIFDRKRAYAWALKASDYPELRKLGASVVALCQAVERAEKLVAEAERADENRRRGATPISDARSRRKPGP